jgi:AcrR family transcriptional regulator
MMGITERREREREEVRQKILEAARELFGSEGYDRVTMRRIAEAIEYSPTTIYNHFKDKDDLVYALCEQDFAQLLGRLEGQVPPRDPVEGIRRLGLAYAQFALDNPNHYRFIFLAPPDVGHVRERGNPGEQSFAVLRAAVEKAIESGRFRPNGVDTVAQILWSSVHGAVALLIALPAEFWPHAPAAPDLVAQVLDNTIRGLLASGAPAEV